jgi:hypothetical protein
MLEGWNPRKHGRQVCLHDILGGLTNGYQAHFPVEGPEKIPVLSAASIESIPKVILPFDNELAEPEWLDVGLHFYCEDRKFISVVADPLRWVSRFAKYKCVLTPDISLSESMAPWQRVKNTVYSRAVGATWQAHGLQVIPSIRWADRADYEFVGVGIPRGSVIAFGALGAYRDRSKRAIFQHGVEAMVERLEPSAIVIYGKLEAKFHSRLEAKVQVHNFFNPRLTKTSNHDASTNLRLI